MRKAMGFLCLLPVMFAFGVPHANAASCDMIITAKNESDASATLKRGRDKAYHVIPRYSIFLAE